MKIFVVGDIGYDNYLVGKVRSLSVEAPIPILDVQGPTLLPGMGLNVLANLHQLGATDAEVILPEAAHYPVKSRLMTEDGQQVARFDLGDWCSPLQRADLLPLIDADAVIVADYGKGAITDEIAGILGQVTAPLFIDTKSDPSRWISDSFHAILFPNQQEWDKYRAKYEWFPRVVLKQGAQGLSYVEYGKATATRPAWAKRVRSVNGAGDTVIAAWAVAHLALQGSTQHCLDVASAAAANVVEQDFLNRTTTPEAVGERIINEVPESVYNPFQTQHNGPSLGLIDAGGRRSLSYPSLEPAPSCGRAAARGTSPICKPDDTLSPAEIMRAVADAMEDDDNYDWCTPDLVDIAKMGTDEWAV